MNFKELYSWLNEELKAIGVQNHTQESMWIITHFCPSPYFHIFSLKEIDEIKELLSKRRLNQLPVVLGYTEFYGEQFIVSQDTLVPRNDSECLVDYIVKRYKGKTVDNIIDICTGTGCLGISVAKNISVAGELLLCDISHLALKVAKNNVEKILPNRARCLEIDLLSLDFVGIVQKEGRYDILICNPPYIKSSELHDLNLKDPKISLDGGDDGLVFYRRLANIFHELVSENGIMVIEHGFNQSREIVDIMSHHDICLQSEIKDLENRIRGLVFARKNLF